MTDSTSRQFNYDPAFNKALKVLDEARYARLVTSESHGTIELIKFQMARGMSRDRMLQIWSPHLVRAAEEQIAIQNSTESRTEAVLAATYGPVPSRHQEISERRRAATGRQK